MSPESSTEPIAIFDEALQIKTALVDVQTQINDITTNVQTALLSTVRKKLGYKEVASPELANIVDTRIVDKIPVITPEAIATTLPLTEASARTTADARRQIERILDGDSDRLMVATGPCSLHDPDAALEYADAVRAWRTEFGDDLEIIMRCYSEKPRSEKDWKGQVYDPLLDDSDDINLGLVVTRLLLCRITDKGVPTSTERLNALTPQYVNGLVAYDAVGARNTTDQKSREYVSGTSSPAGFKNTPEGSIGAAIGAIRSANARHTFLGISTNGLPMQVMTTGNQTAHIILRGSNEGPNYEAKHIEHVKHVLHQKCLKEAIVVDASHGNSGKKADKQKEVIVDIARQILLGERAIKGVMIESNLVAGRQDRAPMAELTYGQSITDECVDLSTTRTMLETLAESVQVRRAASHSAW